MELRQPFESDSKPKPAEQSAETITTGSVANGNRGAALAEARATDAANYVWRYEQFSNEVARLKFWDGMVCMLFPAVTYLLGLAVLLRGLFWMVEHSGSGQSSFAQSAFVILMCGVVGLTAGAAWLSNHARDARKRGQPERIREIATRHGVEPDRPRME